jgi:hypothetical protein
MWRRVLEKAAREPGLSDFVAVAEGALAELPEVSAVQALEADRKLVELLIGRRWMAMQDAREADATWADIGEALGMSRQAAWDWYQRKIEQQERHVPDFHDAEVPAPP